MKIAVNTRLLVPGKIDGIGWFTYETMRLITSNHPEHEFIFLFDRPYSREFIFSENIVPVVAFPPARHPFLWYWWFEYSVPHVLKKYKPDVFLSPDGYLSLRTDIPSVPVIHDINFEHYPGQLPFLTRNYYRNFFPKYAAKATRIATVSEFSKADISSKYRIAPSKIDVVYNGVSELYHAEISEVRKKHFRDEYAGGKEYFIFVGTIHPRKNIGRLMVAFNSFKMATGSDVKLLIAGRKMWWTTDMEQTYEKLEHKNDIHFLGRIDPPELLRDLVASSLAMVYVPVFEGFGIPVIEAQATGVPVVTSNTSSLPEASGNAAVLCDPFSTDSITAALQKIHGDQALRSKLIREGKQNAVNFTWQRTAGLLWETIQSALDK